MRFELNWQAAVYDPKKQAVGALFPAQVPGNVQYDYAMANGFGDFMFADQVKKFEPLEDLWWEYRTVVTHTPAAGESLWFVAEGIDYAYDILLDDRLLYTGEGMYTPVELELTDIRTDALLQVRIHPHPKRSGAPATREQADQSCKPPFCYGWDWNPRLLMSGLWRDAYLETRDAGYIRSCEPFYTLNAARDTASLRFETDCDVPVKYTLWDPDGTVIYEGEHAGCTVENVRLWWCNGQGEPCLYRWRAESGSHSRTGRIGFRTLRLVHNAGADQDPADFPKTRYPAPITVELNGRRIFAKGSNWVNPELFPGRVTEQRYRELLTAAAQANMNILRIWGGSGINKPEFYELCDELGILVWQEFMLSCNNYIGTPQYLRVLESEARSILRQLRSHPSLALWCGGNELFNDWSGMDDQSLALRLLNKLCYEEDRERPFLATSPLFGMSHGGYFFRNPYNGKDVFEYFAASHQTAYTEFGVPSMAPVQLLEKIIPPDELFPPRETDAWLIHHGFSAWVGDSWIYAGTLEHYFGKPHSLAEMTEHSQWLQAVGYKAVFEEARRQWPYCSMAVNWCFEEPWITAANNSLIAYPCEKKPAWYAVGQSLRPVLASARIPRFDWRPGECFSAELWLLNDSDAEVSETVTAVLLQDGREEVLLEWNTGSVPPRTNRLGPQVNLSLPEGDTGEFTLLLRTASEGRESDYRLLLRNTKAE